MVCNGINVHSLASSDYNISRFASQSYLPRRGTIINIMYLIIFICIIIITISIIVYLLNVINNISSTINKASVYNKTIIKNIERTDELLIDIKSAKVDIELVVESLKDAKNSLNEVLTGICDLGEITVANLNDCVKDLVNYKTNINNHINTFKGFNNDIKTFENELARLYVENTGLEDGVKHLKFNVYTLKKQIANINKHNKNKSDKKLKRAIKEDTKSISTDKQNDIK